MKFRKLILIGIILFALFFVFFYKTWMSFYPSPAKPVYSQQTTKDKSDVQVTVVAENSPFAYKNVFYQYWFDDTQSKEDMLKNDIFLFSDEEIVKKEHKELLLTLFREHKTILFFNETSLDVEHTLSYSGVPFEYYQVVSTDKVTTYVYGAYFIEEEEIYRSVALAGNFKPSELEQQLGEFLNKKFNPDYVETPATKKTTQTMEFDTPSASQSEE